MLLTGLARLGRDAEVRFTSGGDAVANLSLAWNYGKKTPEGQPSQWLDGSLWGKRAEALAPYLTKGTLLSIVAEEPHIEEFQGKNGTGHKLVARITSIEFAGGKREEGSAPAQQASAPATQQQRQAPAARPAAAPFDDDSDSIPF